MGGHKEESRAVAVCGGGGATDSCSPRWSSHARVAPGQLEALGLLSL